MGETVLFGRYRLIEPTGAGGSAQVWRATDIESGDEVAVKRLHPIIFADDAGRARLKREFDALRSLDEPHIVHVRDLEIGDDDAALILDFVPGRSLADRLASGAPFEPAEAVAVATDVAAALSAAHAAGIVHRDVTPGNILLDSNDGGVARLTDFGIALGGDAASVVTATGQLMGTLRYLAPEQLRGEPATAASDIHSLAAVTYEMLAGHPPYDATTPVALAEAQDAGAEPLLNVAPALDNAVRRALAPEPPDRPADVATFANELRDGLANRADGADCRTAGDRRAGFGGGGRTGPGARGACQRVRPRADVACRRVGGVPAARGDRLSASSRPLVAGASRRVPRVDRRRDCPRRHRPERRRPPRCRGRPGIDRPDSVRNHRAAARAREAQGRQGQGEREGQRKRRPLTRWSPG